jgi:hypothetical protein
VSLFPGRAFDPERAPVRLLGDQAGEQHVPGRGADAAADPGEGPQHGHLPDGGGQPRSPRWRRRCQGNRGGESAAPARVVGRRPTEQFRVAGEGIGGPLELAALHALRLDADRLPTPRADGDRLLGARRELTTAKTRTINRLRALLLTGSDADRALSRVALTSDRLAAITRRRGGSTRPANTPSGAPRPAASPSPSAGSTENSPITNATSPTWSPTWRHNCWPNAAWAQSAPHKRSCPGPTRAAAATMPHTPRSPAPARSPPAAAASSVTGSTAAATATSTAPCTTSS